MKKNPIQAKYFKYNLTKVMIALAIGVLILCAAGIAVSVYRIAEFGVHGFDDVLKSPLLILISALCIAVVIGILVKSQYVVTDKQFIMQFGFIKNKYDVQKITSLLLNSDNKKLTVYFGEEYVILSISPAENEDFVRAVQAVNPDAQFSFTLTENTENQEN